LNIVKSSEELATENVELHFDMTTSNALNDHP
jgi:hypothetical protein